MKEAADVKRLPARPRVFPASRIPGRQSVIDPALADEELIRRTAELSNHIPFSSGPAGELLEIGARFGEITGVARDQAVEAGVANQIHRDDLAEVRRAWREAIESGQPFVSEVRLRLLSGAYHWYRVRAVPQRDAAGAIQRWYGLAEDIHDFKATELALDWVATHDGLTRLLNRSAFLDAIEGIVVRIEDRDEHLALLVLDVDTFEDVNSQHGSEIGDRLLQQFAARITTSVGPKDLVARLGGDEFGILVRASSLGEPLDATVDALTRTLAQPMAVARSAAVSRVSIGAVIYRGFGADARELMRSATLALREAKQQSHHRVRMFESGMRASLQRRSSMLAVARQALRQKRIVPFYQPKLNFVTRRIEGFEALLRIRGMRPGVIGPNFIAAAFNDPELAVAITDRMLDLVTRDMANWRARGVAFGSVAVNAAQGDLRGGNFPERVFRRLEKANLPPDCLEIEVTETVLLDQVADGAEQALDALSAGGVRIALDDFGTGFASLTHLQRFPVDVIKIDQSFVRDITNGDGEAAIVRAIIDLSRSLSIKTVAEGVETAEQARLLAGMGCDHAQGFLFAQSMPATAVPEHLDVSSAGGLAGLF
jgi:diguanylate cyclase (GGDEF)-like protein/PAS domain S-box-containing protein